MDGPRTISVCQDEVVEDLKRRKPSMERVIRIGMDTSKHVFQLHGVNAAEEPVLRKTLRRKELIKFFEKLPPTVIGIEACGGAHYWGRLLQSFGHDVKLLPPQYVKPYVKRSKNDASDAEALCEAMSRPTMRFVPVKTADQQAALMLVGLRERLIRYRTQLANAIRSYAAEFGLSAAQGVCRIEPLLDRIATDKSLPALARDLLAVQGKEYAQLQTQLEGVEARLLAWHRADSCSRRLAQIPGVGPIGASMLVMKTPAPDRFRSARHFAAWLGLVPRQFSTGGKTRLGRITKTGNREIRKLLVLGATSMVYRAPQWNSVVGAWTRGVLERRPVRLVTVALANKMARIAWALMTRKEVYRATGRVAAATEAAA